MDHDTKFYRVRRTWTGLWGVYEDDSDELAARDPFRTRADAVIHAKELARREGSGAQILVYGEDGMLDSEFFYGPEERDALAGDDEPPSFAASRPASRASRAR
jgi:hypothetical protein